MALEVVFTKLLVIDWTLKLAVIHEVSQQVEISGSKSLHDKLTHGDLATKKIFDKFQSCSNLKSIKHFYVRAAKVNTNFHLAVIAPHKS